MVDWAKLAAEMSGEGAPVSEEETGAPAGDVDAAPAAAPEDPATAASTEATPAPRVDPRTLDDSGAVPASALRATDPMGTPSSSFASQLNKQKLSFESAPPANVADTPLSPTDPDRPSAAPAASPEAVASVPLEVSRPDNAQAGQPPVGGGQGESGQPADWDLSGPVQMTMPSPSVPAPAPVGPLEFKVPALGAAGGQPPRKPLEGFGGAGVDDPTKTAPFPGESAGPWEVPQTPPPEDAPDRSIISEITDPRKKLAKGVPGAPIASNPDGAPAVAPADQQRQEQSAPSQPGPLPVTGITPAPAAEPPSIADDDDDEPSKTQHLPEGEMLRRLDGAPDEQAPRPERSLGDPAAAPSRGDTTDRDLPSIAASDDSTSETEVARPLPSLALPGALAEQAQAGVGPFAPPSAGPLSEGPLSEGPSLEESLTRSLAEEEARTPSIVADDDDDEAASTIIDHKMPPGAALDGFGDNSDEQPPVSAPPTPAADVPVEATEKVTRVREQHAADAFFKDDDDETRKVDIVASGEDEDDVTLKMPAAEGPGSGGAPQEDSGELFGDTAPPHEATEKMPRALGRQDDKHADAFFQDGLSEGHDELSRSLPEPEERSHYAPQSSVSPWSEDDEDPSLVLARAQKRTRLLTAAALMIALFAGAVALFMITPETSGHDDDPGAQPGDEVPTKVADGEGDAPDEPAATASGEQAPGGDDPAAAQRAGERAADPAGGKADPKADDERAARVAKRDDDERRAASRRRERERAENDEAGARRRDADARSGRTERSGRGRKRDDGKAAKDDDDKATKRDNGRSRRRDKGTRVAGATERELAVTAPKRVIWRTPSGKRLGKGSGFLKLAPGVSTVVAHDPFADVKTFIKVTGTQISYAKLPKGKLDIRAFPYAAVYAGKKKLGDAPFPPLEVIEGQYRLRFVYEGKVQKRLVKVKAGKTERVKVNFMQ